MRQRSSPRYFTCRECGLVNVGDARKLVCRGCGVFPDAHEDIQRALARIEQEIIAELAPACGAPTRDQLETALTTVEARLIARHAAERDYRRKLARRIDYMHFGAVLCALAGCGLCVLLLKHGHDWLGVAVAIVALVIAQATIVLAARAAHAGPPS